MKLKVNRNNISIIPENEIDVAYIEEVLKLQKNDTYIKLHRVNVIGMSCLACLETDYNPIVSCSNRLDPLYEEKEQ